MAEETKKCPFCGEEILAVAIKCKHCGSDLSKNKVTPREIETSETLGYIMLLVPFISTLLIWFWVGSMNLLQNPGSSLTMLGAITILITAIIAAVEANQLGFGKSETNKKESGPVAIFLFTALLWIAGFPYYLYLRSKKGKKNLVVGGIILAIIFALSWYFVGSAIDEKVQEIRNAFR